MRKNLCDGVPIDERIIRAPVAEVLGEYYRQKIEKEKKIKSENIKWHDTLITKKDRERVNGHSSTVIWLTGLSASGKSTIAVELQSILFKRGYKVFILDGDNIRHGLNKNLGFSPQDREENIRRVGEVAKLFTEAGFLVITAFISPYKKDRDNVRNLLAQGDFIEVYVKASLNECERRDPKGLYKKAREEQIKEFTGISAPYEEPLNPEIIIDTEIKSKEESAKFITDWLEDRGYIPKMKCLR